MRRSELPIDLGAATMTCTPDDVGTVFAALLAEMRTVTRLLRPDERVALRQIMAADSGALTVGDVFPDFHRESEGHKTLRRLRAAQFVRPAKAGRWSDGEPIEIKPFARLLWDRLGEAEIFGDKPAEPAAAEDEPGEVIIDLEAEDAEVEIERPPAKAEWTDDDVLDYLRDPRESVS